MTITAQYIAEILKGDIHGEPNRIISNIAKIEEAKESELTFLSNEKYLHHIFTTGSDVMIINRNFITDKILKLDNKTLIIVDDAHASFVTLLQLYNNLVKPIQPAGIHPTAVIETEIDIPDSVYIGPFCYIQKNVSIGKNTQIHSNCVIEQNSVIGSDCSIKSGVKIMDNSKLGDRVVIHSNTVVGSDGFGFQANNEGVYSKVPQIGHVVIGDDVEIGANCSIDRATMGQTVIGKGVKIDNLVQIAHNVTIGDHTVIAAQTGISGSTKIGKHCIIGGQVGIVGHITIADKTQINAQSGISKSILNPGLKLTGTPAFDYNSALRSQVIFRKLPELANKIEDLNETIFHMKNKNN